MKITVDVDCTPAEARSFFGLPDMDPVNEMIVQAMVEKAQENLDSLSDPKVFWDRAMAAGGQGMGAMNAIFAAAMGAVKTPPSDK